MRVECETGVSGQFFWTARSPSQVADHRTRLARLAAVAAVGTILVSPSHIPHHPRAGVMSGERAAGGGSRRSGGSPPRPRRPSVDESVKRCIRVEAPEDEVRSRAGAALMRASVGVLWFAPLRCPS